MYVSICFLPPPLTLTPTPTPNPTPNPNAGPRVCLHLLPHRLALGRFVQGMPRLGLGLGLGLGPGLGLGLGLGLGFSHPIATPTQANPRLVQGAGYRPQANPQGAQPALQVRARARVTVRVMFTVTVRIRVTVRVRVSEHPAARGADVGACRPGGRT